MFAGEPADMPIAGTEEGIDKAIAGLQIKLRRHAPVAPYVEKHPSTGVVRHMRAQIGGIDQKTPILMLIEELGK